MSRQPHHIGVITCTAGIVGGDPVLAGTRIPAAVIARAGLNALAYWPHAELTDADITACIDWWEGSQKSALCAIEETLDTEQRTTQHEVRLVLERIKAIVGEALGGLS